MTRKNETRCWIGVGIIYSLILTLFVYMAIKLNRLPKVESPNPITVKVVPPERKNMEALIAESIRGKYVDRISTTVLKESEKYGLPIWFIMATTCAESEDWSGNINHRAHNKRCDARGCLQITPAASFNNFKSEILLSIKAAIVFLLVSGLFC